LRRRTTARAWLSGWPAFVPGKSHPPVAMAVPVRGRAAVLEVMDGELVEGRGRWISVSPGRAGRATARLLTQRQGKDFQRAAVGEQLLHSGVPLPRPGHQGPFAPADVKHRVGRGRQRLPYIVVGRLDCRCGGVLEHGLNAGVMGGDGVLHGLAEVVPQMPGVGDLDGLRGTGAGAFGAGALAGGANPLVRTIEDDQLR
jgi:hypothetical protein